MVQTGSQQRSGAHYIKAVQLIREGHIGPVHKVTVGFTRNVLPGFKPKDLPVDDGNLDWDMWLGPAPKVAFDPFRCIYNFRWFWDYSGGQMTNFGAHHLDIARWALGARGPTAVAGFGGRYAIRDGGETPDVQEVSYQFPSCVVTWSAREINRGARGRSTSSSTAPRPRWASPAAATRSCPRARARTPARRRSRVSRRRAAISTARTSPTSSPA